jgi:ABC-type sugar transport system substrate-binding protein
VGKVWRLWVVAIFLLAAAACGGGAPSGQDSLRVAFIPQLTGIPYFTAMEEGGNRAAKDLGVEFRYEGPTETNAPEQVRIMDSLVRQRFDAISVSVLDPASISSAIADAREQDVTILTSDSDAPESERQAFVAQALDEDLGYTLMDRLAAQIDEEGQIGIVSGEATATNLNTWIKFMRERVENKYPNIEIVDVRYTSGGSAEDAQSQAQELMTRYPDLKGLVAVASTTVPGVAQAVKSAGKAGEVAVIGYGSPDTVRPYIKDGTMKESILWNPEDLGYLTVWAMVQFAREDKPEPGEVKVQGLEKPAEWFPKQEILLLGPPLIIDEGNVDDYDF